jgi:hypothetical protein
MPKIVINEYDLTKAGTGEYENFAVVVPGFVGDTYNEDAFDENGIYECTSQTDFVNNVGKRAANIVSRYVDTEAKLPKVNFAIYYKPEMTGEEPYLEKDDNGTAIAAYYKTRHAFVGAFNALVEGRFNFADATQSTDTVTAVAEDDDGELAAPVSKDYDVYFVVDNTSGELGKLKDKDYEYIKVDTTKLQTITYAAFPEIEEDETKAAATLGIDPIYDAPYGAYYVIKTDDEGQNGSYILDEISHYGNQMAYELLGLGYTVLFKRMTEYTEDELKVFTDDKLRKAVAENGSVTDEPYVNELGAKFVAPEYSAAVNELSDPNFWECLRDKSTYDFRYLVTGLLTNNDGANTCIQSIADHTQEVLLDDASISDGRGDCIALIDLDCAAYEGKTQTQAIPQLAKEAAKWSSAYVAVFAPYVNYILAEDVIYNNSIFPASFHYLACAANSSANNFNEWYANAGYTRGVAKYTIQSTGCKFGEIAVQSLEPRFLLKVGTEPAVDKNGDPLVPAQNADINTSVAVNLIIKIKGSYYLWGNRTGKKLGTRGASDGDLVAQHFLNVRQLCTTIKKQIYVTCRRLTFDPNSNILWTNFRSLLTPMLEQMKADQGIRDYKFVKNTTDRKALLSAKIRIVPIEAVEDFEIGLYLEDSLEDAVISEA